MVACQNCLRKSIMCAPHSSDCLCGGECCSFLLLLVVESMLYVRRVRLPDKCVECSRAHGTHWKIECEPPLRAMLLYNVHTDFYIRMFSVLSWWCGLHVFVRLNGFNVLGGPHLIRCDCVVNGWKLWCRRLAVRGWGGRRGSHIVCWNVLIECLRACVYL